MADILDILNAGYRAVPTEGWAPLKVKFTANILPDLLYDTEQDNEEYLIVNTESDAGQYLLYNNE